ncbi:helix-turn-helix transcriptional regulator, partial [Agathobaculum sp.]|uniref:helix-turn-helix transcriptional regulator n=1 Tax=Agathobaculum sp. TaxID=2048138 RepID=UPI002A7FD0EE
GLSAFTNVHQKELADRIISFDDIHPILNRLLLEALECSHDLDGLIQLLDRRLLEHLQTAYPPELQIATSLMVLHNGNISCNELSASVYFSARHLGRIFENHLGLGVKTFSRLVRINKAIRLLQDPQCSVTHASCEAGFYDSSHFIRDFQSVCGMKPQEFRNNMSDFYSEIAKF